MTIGGFFTSDPDRIPQPAYPVIKRKDALNFLDNRINVSITAGRTITLPAGTYNITNTIDLTDDLIPIPYVPPTLHELEMRERERYHTTRFDMDREMYHTRFMDGEERLRLIEDYDRRLRAEWHSHYEFQPQSYADNYPTFTREKMGDPNIHNIRLEGKSYYYKSSEIKDFILLDKALNGTDDDKYRFLESQGVTRLDIIVSDLDFTFPNSYSNMLNSYGMLNSHGDYTISVIEDLIKHFNEFRKKLSIDDEYLLIQCIQSLNIRPTIILGSKTEREIKRFEDFYKLVETERKKIKIRHRIKTRFTSKPNQKDIDKLENYERKCRQKLHFLKITVIEYANRFIDEMTSYYNQKFKSQLCAMRLAKKWMKDDYDMLVKKGHIDIPSKIYKDHFYRLYKNPDSKVYLHRFNDECKDMYEDGRYMSNYNSVDQICMISFGAYPAMDTILSKYLMIKNEELDFVLCGAHSEPSYTFKNYLLTHNVSEDIMNEFKRKPDSDFIDRSDFFYRVVGVGDVSSVTFRLAGRH